MCLNQNILKQVHLHSILFDSLKDRVCRCNQTAFLAYNYLNRPAEYTAGHHIPLIKNVKNFVLFLISRSVTRKKNEKEKSVCRTTSRISDVATVGSNMGGGSRK